MLHDRQDHADLRSVYSRNYASTHWTYQIRANVHLYSGFFRFVVSWIQNEHDDRLKRRLDILIAA